MQDIVIGSDHRGYILKEFIKTKFSQNFNFIDVGCYSPSSVDYPLVAKDLVNKLKNLALTNKDNHINNTFGIIICGSGIGVSIAVNRFPFIRGALVFNEKVAATARQHNNANVLCLPSDCLSNDEVVSIINTFTITNFEGGRHEKRVQELANIVK